METVQDKSNSFNLERKFVCSHITSLKAYNEFLFVGEGNQIYLFNWIKKFQLEKITVFKSSSIHGIRLSAENHLLFWGAKSYRIFKFDALCRQRLVPVSEEMLLDDWIHDVQWITNENSLFSTFAIISAHNHFSLWNIELKNLRDVQNKENCILYASTIICQDSDVIVIAVGTVFKQILIWSPSSEEDPNGRISSLHSLSGHQGVIFSLTYSHAQRLLSSSSDDRSIRLWHVHSDILSHDLDFWKFSTITCAHVLYGHESRVWASAILDSCVVSIGEDSRICFWSLNGELLKKKNCHKGGSIWCLETVVSSNQKLALQEENTSIVFTGGSDGGVCVSIAPNVATSEHISQNSLSSVEITDFPRIVTLVPNSGKYLATTNNGCIVEHKTDTKSWSTLFSDASFASYCVTALSPGGTFLALGNIKGELALLKLSDNIYIEKFPVHNTKICSLHWVTGSSDYLLTCGIKGLMILWNLVEKDGPILLKNEKEFLLPKCKHHWWSTVALFLSSDDCVVVGDQGGTISLYTNLHSRESQVKPSVTHRHIHGDNGVTDIKYHNSLVYSAGKDGKVQVYTLSVNDLTLLHTIKVSHNMEWIGRIIFFENDLLLLGFRTKDFVLWSHRLGSALMSVECGGGHRSWDFSLSHDANATFVAIKKKEIIHCERNLLHDLKNSILKAGISGQEFCCTTYLFTMQKDCDNFMSVVACAGEDNAIRIIGLSDRADCDIAMVDLCHLSGHLSSIKAMSVIQIKDSYLMASAGGRSQLMLWKVVNRSPIRCEQLGCFILSVLDKSPQRDNKSATVDPQTRLMDVNISCPATSDSYVIATACSDSFFRLYTFDMKSRHLSLTHNLYHGEHCMLRLSRISFQCDHYFVSGATDGYVKILKHAEDQISSQVAFQVKAQQSGINALDCKQYSDTSWIISLAGDDNALCLLLVNITTDRSELNVISHTLLESAHSSQITGLKILDMTTLVTASIDQRINIWSFNLITRPCVLQLLISKVSIIPDIAHLEAWKNIDGKWTFLISGQGLECFRLT